MDQIEYSFHPVLEQELAQGVFDLLAACDSDFVPPLSKRTSTHQMAFDATASGPVSKTGPELYFDEMKEQSFIIAAACDRVVGFLSYIPNFELDCIEGASSYVSTVCVDPAMRCRGIANSLYGYLEDIIRPRVISLRTWSSNTAQMHVLEKRGYSVVKRVADDRGPGIDSVYYARFARR